MRKIGLIKKIISALLALLLLDATPLAFGWGNEGHTYVNRVAAEKVPASMPLFFRQSEAEIAYLGPEPDRWRSPSEFALKNSQEPDHFIDLERVSWLDPLPQGRYQFYRKLFEKRATMTDHADDYLPEHVGLQPYITMEIYDRLKAGFREYRKLKKAGKPTLPVQRAIVFYAGWLGHYVGDAAQPLHTTIHSNGWVGDNPNGYTTGHQIHWQFEGTFVAANIAAADFAAQVHAPAKLDDPFNDYMAYLKHSHELVEKVYILEKAGGFTGRGSPESLQFTRERLAAGSQMLLNLWYTAWLESAKPEVPAFSAPPKKSGPA